MKTTNRCPKCQSVDIRVGRRTGYAVIQLTWWRSVFTEVYMCKSCGYAEEYVKESDINKLRS